MASGPGKQVFDQEVAGILSMRCAACHEGVSADIDGPNFLGASKSSYYASIKSDPSLFTDPGSSMLLLKGEHTGPALDASEAAAVADWLEAEHGADPGGTTTGGTTSGSGRAAIEQFGRCMTLDDWIETEMYRFGTMQTADRGPCSSCHHTGTGGTYIMSYDEDADPREDPQVSEGFEANRQMDAILKLALWTVNSDGSFNDIVPAYRWRDKGGEPGDHPRFGLPEGREDALDTWFDRTYERWLTGACDPGL